MRIRRWLFLPLLLLTLVGGLLAFRPADYYFEIAKNIDIFASILREVDRHYVDEIEPNAFVREGIDNMLGALDPYTNFISASDIEDFRFMNTGQYGGIGASIVKRDSFFYVADPYQGSPAYTAGLRGGDQLLRIETENLLSGEYTIDDVRNLLRGQPNTQVQVQVRRPFLPPDQQDTFELAITRQNIQIPSIRYAGLVAPGVAYVQLRSFTENASRDVLNAFDSLKTAHPEVDQYVLDLRDNPGGLLNEAVNLANVFIPKGQKVVETRGRVEGANKTYRTQNAPWNTESPVAVLINGNSASASEIVSGVLKDLDRGVVVGQRSFGKGLVQTTVPLSYNTQMKITTARYYTPSGRCIQKIEYAEGAENRSVVPNLDRSEGQDFTTANGRPVVDHDGIMPDIEVAPREYHSVIQALYAENLVEDFGVYYYNRVDSLPPPAAFTVSDSLFNAFLDFTRQQDFSYESELNQALKKLRQRYQEEPYYNDIQPTLEALAAETRTHTANDLLNQRPTIERLLRAELISRYYYEAGRVQVLLDQDPVVDAAVEVLGDSTRYAGLLQGSIPPVRLAKEQEPEEPESPSAGVPNLPQGE